MRRVEGAAALREVLAEQRRDGRRFALVPTMGALHAGHESLVQVARAGGDAVVLSVFVNPLQFGPAEDFERYPRDLERDVRLARAWGVDALFAPAASELLPGAPVVTVDPGPLESELEGSVRPGHFRGVLTIVAKLLHAVAPDRAVFGQKDLQQAVLVRAMVRDLDFPCRIDIGATVREPDGLALSSRNAYLTPAEREVAPALHRALAAGADAVRAGERRSSAVRDAVVRRLNATPQLAPDYVAVVSAADLRAAETLSGDVAVLAAARLGRTRLLDNEIVQAAPGGG